MDKKLLESLNWPLQPYDVHGICNNDKIRVFFEDMSIPENKYKLIILFSGVDIHDIYGDTGKVELVSIGYGNTLLTKYYKYIGDLGMDADQIRKYLKDLLF